MVEVEDSKVKIDEQIGDRGLAIVTCLEVRGSVVVVREGGVELGGLPVEAVAAVMRRYGRPLEAGVVVNGERIDLTDELHLGQLRFRAAVDAEPRDWVVLEGGGDALAADGRTVAAALRFLIDRSAG